MLNITFNAIEIVIEIRESGIIVYTTVKIEQLLCFSRIFRAINT